MRPLIHRLTERLSAVKEVLPVSLLPKQQLWALWGQVQGGRVIRLHLWFYVACYACFVVWCSFVSWVIPLSIHPLFPVRDTGLSQTTSIDTDLQQLENIKPSSLPSRTSHVRVWLSVSIRDKSFIELIAPFKETTHTHTR